MSAMTCSVLGCRGGVKARGMCGHHYDALRKAGKLDPNYSYKAPATGCSEPGCERTAFARGLCNMHYLRAYHAAKGRPLKSKVRQAEEIAETKRKDLERELQRAQRAYELVIGWQMRAWWRKQIDALKHEASLV